MWGFSLASREVREWSRVGRKGGHKTTHETMHEKPWPATGPQDKVKYAGLRKGAGVSSLFRDDVLGF